MSVELVTSAMSKRKMVLIGTLKEKEGEEEEKRERMMDSRRGKGRLL
jgi:hypothetical protein